MGSKMLELEKNRGWLHIDSVLFGT